ncbi:MAG: H-X9-DG-CTERM domain-containing protein [Planctomycetaceae bacterium]
MTDEEAQQDRLQQQLRVGTFGSSHSYGVNFVYADGSAKAMGRQIASAVLERAHESQERAGESARRILKAFLDVL